MTCLKKQNGLTLLTALLALFVLSIVILLFTQLTSVLRHIHTVQTANLSVPWITAHQLEFELLNGSNATVTNQVLSFSLNGQTISYFQNGTRLVRQLNNQGFEIVLQDLSTVEFHKTGSLISMDITMNQGRVDQWLFLSELN